jgi:long-chain fatty acid adenylase/transferase FadD26
VPGGSRNGRIVRCTRAERSGAAMPVMGHSLPALLRKRVEQQPDSLAFTFVDGANPTEPAESLTWSQVYQRAQVVAGELRLCGSPGDRAAILAPHGLDYIAAFLGALQAGFIAVPLSVPQFGIHDERISSAIRDAQPIVLLTTSAVVGDVTKYAQRRAGQPAPFVVEVDLLGPYPAGDLHSEVALHSGPAYLQYTSGSTRTPTGVVVSHRNVVANVQQAVGDYIGQLEKVPSIRVISWLPFFHDMGLIVGILAPMIAGRSAVLLSPTSFLSRPACWLQLLAAEYPTFSAAPNFAFELAVRRTSDDDMAGRDLGNVVGILSGSERVHVATVRRFAQRFEPFNLKPTAIRPSYGLAEATLYVAASEHGTPPKAVPFDHEQLSAGQAKPAAAEDVSTSALISYGVPRTSTVRIVDPDARAECPAGVIGEIWVHGENVAMGYWRKPEQSELTFGARLVNPTKGTPEGPWLRTGDLGAFSDGELFIMGRLKDMVIVDGRNHFPDDIEATVQEITGGRVAAIAVPKAQTEHLVVIAEVKRRAASSEENNLKLRKLKRDVSSAVSATHGLRVADLVVVEPGSIPITTSGKIRRSACIERYLNDQFARSDIAI